MCVSAYTYILLYMTVCLCTCFYLKQGMEQLEKATQLADLADILLGVIITYNLSYEHFTQSSVLISSALSVLSGRENSSQGDFI